MEILFSASLTNLQFILFLKLISLWTCENPKAISIFQLVNLHDYKIQHNHVTGLKVNLPVSANTGSYEN